MKIEKLLAKARLVTGAEEHITRIIKESEAQSTSLIDIDVREDYDVAAYLLEKHYWGNSGGIEMKSVIGIYSNGQFEEKAFTFRHRYDANEDKWSKYFSGINILLIDREEQKNFLNKGGLVMLEAIPHSKEYGTTDMKFFIELYKPNLNSVDTKLLKKAWKKAGKIATSLNGVKKNITDIVVDREEFAFTVKIETGENESFDYTEYRYIIFKIPFKRKGCEIVYNNIDESPGKILFQRGKLVMREYNCGPFYISLPSF